MPHGCLYSASYLLFVDDLLAVDMWAVVAGYYLFLKGIVVIALHLESTSHKLPRLAS